MGDWEDMFGMDAGETGHFAWQSCNDVDPESLEDFLKNGSDLRRAPTLFDLTGQVWHASESPRPKFSYEELNKIHRIAREAADNFSTDALPNVEDWGEAAAIFLVHAQRAMDLVGPSLDAIETCLISIVEQVDYCDLVLARDTSHDNGHVSRTLSSHIIAFPEEQYIARLGDLTLRGPYCTFPGWRHCDIVVDSFCGLANEKPECKVLAVSNSLLDENIPLRSASEWALVNQGDSSWWSNGYRNLYSAAAKYAARLNGQCRTWTDTAESTLRTRVYEILCALLPDSERVYITLDTNPHGSRLYMNEHFGDIHGTLAILITYIFQKIDLSNFRANSRDILLIDSVIPSQQSRQSGIAHLIELFDGVGVDASAAREALRSYDHRALLLVIEPYDVIEEVLGEV